MEGIFSKEEVLMRISRKANAVSYNLNDAKLRLSVTGHTNWQVRVKELENELAFLNSIIFYLAPETKGEVNNPMKLRPISALPISIRLYQALKRYVGNGDGNIPFFYCENLRQSECLKWRNFGRTSLKELLAMCEEAGIRLLK